MHAWAIDSLVMAYRRTDCDAIRNRHSLALARSCSNH